MLRMVHIFSNLPLERKQDLVSEGTSLNHYIELILRGLTLPKEMLYVCMLLANVGS